MIPDFVMKTISNVKPTRDLILVLRDSPEMVTAQGIHLPKDSIANPLVGTILKVGPDTPKDYWPGQRVYMSQIGTREVKFPRTDTEGAPDLELALLTPRDIYFTLGGTSNPTPTLFKDSPT